MAWDKTKPAATTQINNSNPELLANLAALETVLGTNLTAGPTSIQDAVKGDGTKGRVLRVLRLNIVNGTDANTLKCTVSSVWNGDAIAETDNIAKNATTGNFSLTATGKQLTIEAAGLTGNCLLAMGYCWNNASGVVLTCLFLAVSNDIIIQLKKADDAVDQDITVLVDTGVIYLHILYLTDA